MTPEQIQQWACEAGFSPQRDEWVFNTMLRTFAALVRNATLDSAKEVCRQVVREANTTLTWEGCAEIQEALEREKT
jgi:hypothetical protein